VACRAWSECRGFHGALERVSRNRYKSARLHIARSNASGGLAVACRIISGGGWEFLLVFYPSCVGTFRLRAYDCKLVCAPCDKNRVVLSNACRVFLSSGELIATGVSEFARGFSFRRLAAAADLLAQDDGIGTWLRLAGFLPVRFRVQLGGVE